MTGPTRRRRTPAVRRPKPDVPQHLAPTTTVEPVDPAVVHKWERIIGALFLLSAGCTLGFIVAYVLIHLESIDSVYLSNFTLGMLLTGMVGFLGFGLVLWTKKLMPHFDLVEERHDPYSTEEDRTEFAEVWNQGVAETGLKNYKILRRSLLASAAVLPLPLIVLLRDMGPLPHNTLRHTRWYKGARLVDIVSKQPVHVGDLEVGGLLTVMPEGVEVTDENAATSPTMLVRLAPGVNHPLPGRADWAPDGYIAYNKICTHAGCPISLYEQQTHLLFCPCHQSTFDVIHGCKVVFGPAARDLPQLPIYIDSAGYLRARSDFTEPVGPSFWERG